MRVSWLIPVRDAVVTVAAAVGSALGECGPDDEVVVVDDGSRDGSADAVPRDPRVRLVRGPAGGIVAALERGRAACRGRYVARLDADDEALPGRIAAQLAVLEARPDVVAVGGRARLVGPVGEGMRRYTAWINGLEDLHRELCVEAPLFHPATTLRADALHGVGGWRAFDGPEDYDLWLRLVDAGGRLAAVPREVVAMRDRPDRLTRTDPRYRPAAFVPLRQAFLGPRLPRRVVLWGAGRAGRPWTRWLLDRGHDVPAVLDLRAGGTRHGVPVRAREDLEHLELDALVVAVGARGARAEIRERIAAWRPELVEGRDWWAVA